LRLADYSGGPSSRSTSEVSRSTRQAKAPRGVRSASGGILHFDAHHDLYADLAFLNHANPFLSALDSRSLRWFRQFGLRTIECPLANAVETRDPRLSFVGARDLQSVPPPDASGQPRLLPCYLGFDVDCLDPTLAPATGFSHSPSPLLCEMAKRVLRPLYGGRPDALTDLGQRTVAVRPNERTPPVPSEGPSMVLR
jgi:hypothetical protein